MKDATWAASGAEVLFMHWVGTTLGVAELVCFKPLPCTGWSHTFQRWAICCLGCPVHLSFHCGKCQQSGTEWTYGTLSASSDDVTLAFTAFLPGKSKATGLEMIFPFSNMQPESNILHFQLLANPPPHYPHPHPSLSVTHAGSIHSTSRT